MKPRMWFMVPNVTAPTGGTNNCYRLCDIANELNIEAGVLSSKPYEFINPPEFKKYWRYAENSFSDIAPGDIAITPEIWRNRPMFGVPIRHILYVQGWSIAHHRMPHERIFWYYGGIGMNYSQGVIGEVNPLHHDLKMTPTEDMELHHTAKYIDKPDRIEWIRVQPYFDDVYEPESEDRDRNQAMILGRRCPAAVEKVKKALGNRVTIISGVQPEDMPKIYNKYGVFILISPAEGLCYPAIEALMSETAIVSWPCGAPEEYLINDETAIMVKFGDIDNLTKESKNLLNNHNKQIRLAKKGNQLVRGMFSREQTKIDLYLAYHLALRHDPY